MNTSDCLGSAKRQRDAPETMRRLRTELIEIAADLCSIKPPYPGAEMKPGEASARVDRMDHQLGEVALRVRDVADRVIADEDAGGGDGMVPPPHDSLRAALRDSSKKVADGKLADDTPPQQRDALDAALKDKGYCFAELSRGEFAVDDAPVLVPILVRALANPAPPTVPELVRSLPDEWRGYARQFREIGSPLCHAEADKCEKLADELDRALAQSGEGRVSEDTARLDKLERLGDPGAPWIARQSSQGRGCRLHQTTRGGAHPTARAAIDAAPEPGPEKNDA